MSDETDTLVPPKRTLRERLNGRAKQVGVAGSIIAALSSLGYADIQRRENNALLETNLALIQTITKQAETYFKACHDQN